MAITGKRFITGGKDRTDIHKEIYQMTEEGSAIINDPRHLILEEIWKNLEGLPSAPVTREQIEEVYDGKSLGLTLHPRWKTPIFENGREIFENTISVSRALNSKGECAGLQVETSAAFGAYKTSEEITQFSIEDSDLCFVVVGNVFRGAAYGGTLTTAVCPPFEKEEDARAFLAKRKEILSEQFSQIDVEAFSKSHLEQVSWYQNSIVTFPYYQNLCFKEDPNADLEPIR